MRKLRVVLISLCILLVSGACISFVAEGFHHVNAASELRHAQEYWQNGEVGKSLPKFVAAFRLALESGIRWSIANGYINQMRSLNSAGRLREALTQCTEAVQTLDGFDDEGIISYECAAIGENIRRQSPPIPIPQSEP